MMCDACTYSFAPALFENPGSAPGLFVVVVVFFYQVTLIWHFGLNNDVLETPKM